MDLDGRLNPLAQLTLSELRTRTSVKWQVYPPDVLPMWVAEMDTPLAPPIRQVLAEAVERGDTGYAHPGRLREAFSTFAGSRFGWRVDPAAVAVIPNVLHGIATVLEQVTAPGDGVLINSPVYHPFYSYIPMAGRQVVTCPLVPDAAGRWSLDLDRLEAALARPDVTAYLLCSPHNPTGTVFDREELLAVAALAERHRVRMIVDEIHGPLTYPGAVFTPFLSLADRAAAAADGFAFTSASKAWNLAGLVTAVLIGGPGALADLAALPRRARDGVGPLRVLAAEAAFLRGEPWLDALLVGLDANRRLLAELLAERLPAVRYRPPEGTYLAWLDCRGLRIGDDDPAKGFLRRGRVALNGGPMFGDPGKGHVRLCFATSPAILAEGVDRMAAAVAAADGDSQG